MFVFFSVLVTILLLPLVSGKSSGELCAGTAHEVDGNWYCAEVEKILYRNISQSGTYNHTKHIDVANGICNHEPVSYPGNGPLTPLFGEVSMHIRGPMTIQQLAVYTLSFSDIQTKKRRDHQNRRQKRSILKEVRQESSGSSTASLGEFTTVALDARNMMGRQDFNSTCISSTDIVTGCTQNSVSPTSTSDRRLRIREEQSGAVKAGGDWQRVAYYTSSAPASASGFAFMANLGAEGCSGTFDTSFGNSLSYVNGKGDKCAPQPTAFDGKLETSEVEIVVFTDRPCSGDDCGYVRPNTVAHHGWTGSSKAFIVEFQMDHALNKGSDQGLIDDAPAWWFLNAHIPRILQYGNDRKAIPCSCWSSGCGEFDAFEVLTKGEEKAKSTLHRQGNLEGGDSNYFKRPVGKSMKFGVVWHEGDITATVLDDKFGFSEGLTQGQLDEIVAYDEHSSTQSRFDIGR